MKKNYWGFVIGAVAVVIVGGIIWWVAAKNKDKATVADNSSSTQVAKENQGETASSTLSTTSSTQPSGAKPKVPVNSKLAAYTDAVNKYQYRIQFDQCHGVVNTTNAGTLSIKKGAAFMLDNRDDVAHTFAFKGHSYKIGAYSYVITSATVVGTYPITCDGGGAASLNVE